MRFHGSLGRSAGLNVTDELFKALQSAEDTQRDSRAAAQITTRLIGMIDQTLVDGQQPGSGAPAPAPEPSGRAAVARDPQNEVPSTTAE